MKYTFKTRRGDLIQTSECEDEKLLFRSLSRLIDIFDEEQACGCCNSLNIRPQHRNIDDNDYYTLVCRDCSAQFSFGQTRKGDALFPKRTDSDKNPLPNRGWHHWKGRAIEAPAAAGARR